jgi:hypothetical protein
VTDEVWFITGAGHGMGVAREHGEPSATAGGDPTQCG